MMAMMFAGFSVLIAWVLWSYKMGFGATSLGGGVKTGADELSGGGIFQTLLCQLRRATGHGHNGLEEQGQAVSAANTVIPFHLPTDSLVYFQFVFAAITPLLFLGACSAASSSVHGILFPLWSTFVYGVDASCSGAAVTSPRKVLPTSPAASSSTCRPVSPALLPPGLRPPFALRPRTLCRTTF